MSYDAPFEFLSPNEEVYLAGSANKTARIMYIDCLALMQDLVAEFGASSLRPIFEPREIQRAAAEARANFPRSAHFVKNNVEMNMMTALDLHAELTSTSRQVMHSIVRSYVDEYLNDLINQYQIIRRGVVP
jgi:hypothetical protein